VRRKASDRRAVAEARMRRQAEHADRGEKNTQGRGTALDDGELRICFVKICVSFYTKKCVYFSFIESCQFSEKKIIPPPF
jgi:hypothetical protein